MKITIDDVELDSWHNFVAAKQKKKQAALPKRKVQPKVGRRKNRVY